MTTAQERTEVQPRAVRLLRDALTPEQRTRLADLDDAKSMNALARIYARNNWEQKSDSTFSRWFKAIGDDLLKELNERDLAPLNICAIEIDGVGVGNGKRKRTIVWALGITVDGLKVPLGLVEDDVDRKTLAEPTELVAKLLKDLRDRHLDWSDALWVIDGGKGLHSAIVAATNGQAAIQRCVLHKVRNIMKELPPADRKEKGAALRKKLWEAYDEPNLTKAAATLLEASSGLLQMAANAGGDRQKRLLNAAGMVLSNADEVLMLQSLGLVTPGRSERRQPRRKRGGNGRRSGSPGQSLDDRIATTNLIESIHDRIAEWTKAMVSYWQDKGMRSRWFVFGLATAEPQWTRLNVPRREGEQLQLAVLKRRNSQVELDTTSSAGRLILSRVALADGLQITSETTQTVITALSDLARWADRNAQVIELEPDAVEQDGSAFASEVARWAQEHGFVIDESGGRGARVRTPRTRPARAREAASSARVPRPEAVVRQLSRAVSARTGSSGAALLNAIGEFAVERAPQMIGKTPAELAAEFADAKDVLEQLRDVDHDIDTWLRENWQGAAAEVAHESAASEGERSARAALGSARWRALGHARGAWLAGLAAYGEGLIDGGKPVPTIHQPFAGLDALAGRLQAAGAMLAAAHELERRRLLEAAQRQAIEHAGAIEADRLVAPVENHRSALGDAGTLISAYGAALRPELQPVDRETLLGLRRELENLWVQALDEASGERTVGLEDRQASVLERYTASRRNEGKQKALAAHPGVPDAERKQAAEQADHWRGEAEGAWGELASIQEDLTSERKNRRSRDAFVLQRVAEAALDEAIWLELDRGREHEQAVEGHGQAPAQPQVEHGDRDAAVALDALSM